MQQHRVGTTERGGILIYHERCHYHANDFSENTIITNNRNLNISSGLSDTEACSNGKLLCVYEKETLKAGESTDRKHTEISTNQYLFFLLIETSRHILLNLGEIRK